MFTVIDAGGKFQVCLHVTKAEAAAAAATATT